MESGMMVQKMMMIPNTLAIIQRSEDPPSFMHPLELQAMYAPKFLEYANMASNYAANDELCVGMEFNDRETVVRAIKNYNIFKSVDYYVWKSELRTFYYKCIHYGVWCNWLVRFNLGKKRDI